MFKQKLIKYSNVYRNRPLFSIRGKSLEGTEHRLMPLMYRYEVVSLFNKKLDFFCIPEERTYVSGGFLRMFTKTFVKNTLQIVTISNGSVKQIALLDFDLINQSPGELLKQYLISLETQGERPYLFLFKMPESRKELSDRMEYGMSHTFTL